MIKCLDLKGKQIKVSKKAYDIIYSNIGYKLIECEDDKISKESLENIEHEDLKNLTIDELKSHAKNIGLKGYSALKKEEIIELIEGAR